MTQRPAHGLHVHVKRLVVDAGVLGGTSAESLRAQVAAVLQQDLGAESAQLPVGPLASRIGAVVTPAINEQLQAPRAPDGNAGAGHG
jgi:hypothetical protein